MSGSIQIGDFRIERQIGAGGMGVVYLATQVSLNRLVALKVLGQSLTQPSDKARFQREAQAVARLNHPGIAAIHFVGQDDRLCYMAIEYIEGVSLREVIERLARTTKPDSGLDDCLDSPSAVQPSLERFDQLAPTVDEIVSEDTNPYRSPQAEEAISRTEYVRRCSEIIRDAALALEHAHEHGVVHRDLKPENLMLGKDRKIRVIDFGVARFFDDATVTLTGALVGTPMYMSPEQVTGRISLDHRTDIYSLGMVLYELLVLEQPITGPNRDAILRRIVSKPLLPISRSNTSVGGSLESIVHKATAKDVDDRYQSAGEFADDLTSFLAGNQLIAPPYRYRIDESEIRGQRPSFILLLSFLNFSVGMCFGLMCVAAILNWVNGGRLITPLLFLCMSALGGWTVFTGWGLSAGRSWARVSYAIQMLLFAALLVYYAPNYEHSNDTISVYDRAIERSNVERYSKLSGHENAETVEKFQRFIDDGVEMFKQDRRRELRQLERDRRLVLLLFFGAVALSCLAFAPYISKKSRKWFAFASQVRNSATPDVN